MMGMGRNFFSSMGSMMDINSDTPPNEGKFSDMLYLNHYRCPVDLIFRKLVLGLQDVWLIETVAGFTQTWGKHQSTVVCCDFFQVHTSDP